MIRKRTPLLALTLASIAGVAFAAQVSGVGDGTGTTRLEACRRAIQESSSHATPAAEVAQRNMDQRTLVTVEISPCECEQAATGVYPWTCIAPWRLVAMPAERH